MSTSSPLPFETDNLTKLSLEAVGVDVGVANARNRQLNQGVIANVVKQSQSINNSKYEIAAVVTLPRNDKQCE